MDDITKTNTNDVNDSIATINSLIEKSADTLVCDFECQKQRKIDNLKKKYTDAKNNLKTAPFKVVETEKQYYTYVNGEFEYDEYRHQQLEKNADKIINLYKNKFNNFKENNEILLKELEIIKENGENTYDLYGEYINDNKHIERKFKKNESNVFTNFRKTYYGINEYYNIMDKYNFYYKFYYIFAVIYIILLVIFGIKKYKTTKIVGLIIIVLFFPYLIRYAFKIIIFLYLTIKNKIIKYIPTNDLTNAVFFQSQNVIIRDY